MTSNDDPRPENESRWSFEPADLATADRFDVQQYDGSTMIDEVVDYGLFTPWEQLCDVEHENDANHVNQSDTDLYFADLEDFVSERNEENSELYQCDNIQHDEHETAILKQQLEHVQQQLTNLRDRKIGKTYVQFKTVRNKPKRLIDLHDSEYKRKRTLREFAQAALYCRLCLKSSLENIFQCYVKYLPGKRLLKVSTTAMVDVRRVLLFKDKTTESDYNYSIRRIGLQVQKTYPSLGKVIEQRNYYNLLLKKKLGKLSSFYEGQTIILLRNAAKLCRVGRKSEICDAKL